MSTPRRLRRSISTGDVSVNQSPLLKKEDIGGQSESTPDKEDESEGLKERIQELEHQLNDAMDKLLLSQDSVVVRCEHETVEEELRTRVEQLEAELETHKVELRLRDEDRKESEMLAEQLDSLKVSLLIIISCFYSNVVLLLQLQSDYAYTLKSENELLNQDIKTLEEELTKSKEERDLV